MTTYGVTMSGKRRHEMKQVGRNVWAKCGVDAAAFWLTPIEKRRLAAFPVCKRCEPHGAHAEPPQEEGTA
jgi:hypothetical protein